MSTNGEAWIRLDNDVPFHPKVVQLDASGFAWFVAAICYADRFRTDGTITASAVRSLSPQVSGGRACTAAQRCVDVGLLELLNRGDCRIHDYLEHQRNGDARRERERIRKAAWRERQRVRA